MANHENPEGLLARRILVLEKQKGKIPGVDDSEFMFEQLVSKGKETLTQIDHQNAFLALDGSLHSDEIAQKMAVTGRRALEEILSRKEAGLEIE